MKQRPNQMTIMEAIDQIVVGSSDCELDVAKLTAIEKPLTFLAEKLAITKMQALLLAAFVNFYDNSYIEIGDLARHFDCSRVRILKYNNDIEALITRRFINFRASDNDYTISPQVIRAFSRNEVYTIPEQKELDIDALFDAIQQLCAQRECGNIGYRDFDNSLTMLLDDNAHLHFVQTVKQINLSSDDRNLLIWGCNMLVNDYDPDICDADIRRLVGRDSNSSVRKMRNSLISGNSKLIQLELLTPANNNGLAVPGTFQLSRKSSKELLGEMFPEPANANRGNLRSYKDIAAKSLYYNESEQQQINRLEELLREENFSTVCSRLEAQGMRRGFACLFYGAPGTGKTETVLQLARKTGRDIMQVNISEMKSKWVGESEKNVKALFDRYRNIVQRMDKAPILLFNEADAIISARMNNAQRAVDKMDNAIQNIILEEIEKLEGILIATTNLEGNMDKAFERRFIYKIEFGLPSLEARQSIWQAMIPELNNDDAAALAANNDLSGGEIEIIVRKYTVDHIINGTAITRDGLQQLCDTERLSRRKSVKIGY